MEPGVLHVSEADILKDIAAVLEKVRQGNEVVIEQDHRPIAVIKPANRVGRPISEVVAELNARGSTAVIDDDFARDIESGIGYAVATSNMRDFSRIPGLRVVQL